MRELNSKNVVTSFIYEPERFCLSGSFTTSKEVVVKNKQKTVKRNLLMSHSYSCDFKVVWNAEYKDQLFSDVNDIKLNTHFVAQKINEEWISYLEVKPEWDFNNMTRLFILNQKWVYDKHGVYIQLFKPIEFFKSFFIPERYKYTDAKLENRKINFFYLTFDQWYEMNFKPKNLNSYGDEREKNDGFGIL